MNKDARYSFGWLSAYIEFVKQDVCLVFSEQIVLSAAEMAHSNLGVEGCFHTDCVVRVGLASLN